MAKSAVMPSPSSDALHSEQIEQSLAEVEKILKELAKERKEYARRNPPRPRIVDEIKALLAH